MPISSMDGCSAEHWKDVLGILRDVCESAGFIANLVSDADDIGIIHNRIVENIYSSDLVICDVSCKNANVMFELGMRLAFDKPTIIIKDELTGYSFDTSMIEHLEYPRDLRFTSIVRFKDNLEKKMIATHQKAISDPQYSTFLKNFGKYKIAHLENKDISSETFIVNAIEELKRDIRIIKNQSTIEPTVAERGFKSLLTESSERELLLFKRVIMEYVLYLKSRKSDDSPIALDEAYEDFYKNFELRRFDIPRANMRRMLNDALIAENFVVLQPERRIVR